MIQVSQLTAEQKSIVESVPNGIKFLHGACGTGKTTVGVRRMLRLLTKDKVFAHEILVVVPQAPLGQVYQDALQSEQQKAGGRVTVATWGSITRKVVELFFPLVVTSAGFAQPDKRPTFLSLETALYFMQQAVGQVIAEEALFDSITLARNRLYSQLLDNLNKAALVGFPHTDLATRLKRAHLNREGAQARVYDDAQRCVVLFRELCLAHSLIDYSLQVELFWQLWQMPTVQDYLQGKYRHLILDNIEEESPITHDCWLEWLPKAESALVIMDEQAGYRRFLGADPHSAERLKELVKPRDTRFLPPEHSFTNPPSLQELGGLFEIIHYPSRAVPPSSLDPHTVMEFGDFNYFTDMIEAVADSVVDRLTTGSTNPSEMVILSAFLSDSLLFSLNQAFERRNIALRAHRPSQALRDEPAARALLSLAQVVNPSWKLPLTDQDVTLLLLESLEGLDDIRARLIVQHLYRGGQWIAFHQLDSTLQERITFVFGEKYEALREWIKTHQQAPIAEMDVLWSVAFGELLSQVGFGFHQHPHRAEVTANLMDSARQFRRAVTSVSTLTALGREYIQLVREGVIANQYVRSWQMPTTDAILVAPAYTYLMSNRPTDYQYWLNIGSVGWWERIYQPLTHPYVLSRNWNQGLVWTDEQEYYTRNEALYHLVLGLIRNCRKGIYFGFSHLGEMGYEQHGPLLHALQSILRYLARNKVSSHV